MVKNIRFFSSLDATKNREAKEAIKKMHWVKVEWIAPSKFLDEIEDVPFIHTDEGDRYFGTEDIKHFVKDELAAASQIA